jgi:RNA polymerase sigma factor (sigma-70 family)
MPQATLRDLFRFLHRHATPLDGPDRSDGELLRRFRERRDEAAFEALLGRHGPMVLGVCRRVAGDAHAAEDAFQATFLILAKKAASIRHQASVSNWLFGVARRVAGKARAQAEARRDRERQAANVPHAEPFDELAWQELRGVLDEEVGRLPEKCRAAVVLCHLEGKSYDQAAQELGCPKSTLASRLAKAHELLRGQLARRGLTLSAAALTTVLAEKAAAAPVPALLALPLLKAAACVAAGKTLEAGGLSPRAIDLAEETMRSGIGIQGKWALLLLALGLAAGAAFAGYEAWVGLAPPAVEPPKPSPPPTPAVVLPGDPLPAGAVARLGQDRWLHQTAELAAFLPDGKRVVTVSYDMTVRFWEFPSGKEITNRRIALNESGRAIIPYAAAALSRDGKTLATSFPGLGVGREIQFHDVATGKRLAPLKIPFPGGGIGPNDMALALSPAGDQLAVRTRDGAVQVWEWARARKVCQLPPYEGSNSYGAVKLPPVYSPDGKWLATTPLVKEGNDLRRVVKLWDAVTGADLRTVRQAGDSPLPLFVAFSPDGKTLAVATPADVRLVEAATGKDVHTLTGPPTGEQGVRNPLFSKDGKKLYTLAGGAQLREWDVATGKLLRECPTRLYTFALSGVLSPSPDGNTLVVAGYGPQFFDLSGKEITAVHRPAAPVRAVHFTPDGQTLLAYSRHDSVLVEAPAAVGKCDVTTGRDLGTLPIRLPATPRRFTVISPDGRWGVHLSLVGVRGGQQFIPPEKAAAAKPAVLFDTATGKEIAEVAPASEGSYLFSADGKLLAAFADPVGQTIHLYELPGGKRLHTLANPAPAPDPRKGLLRPAPRMFFSPDGGRLAVLADPKAVTFWDTRAGRRLLSAPLSSENLPPEKVAPQNVDIHAAFSPDGRCLAVDGNDGTAVVYELATARPRHRFGKRLPQGPPLKVRPSRAGPDQPAGSRVGFSPDGRLFAQGTADGTVHVYDVLTGQELAAFRGHTAAVNAVAFAPDGKRLASGSGDGTALVWDVPKRGRPAPRPAGGLEKSWAALADDDPAIAFDAMAQFLAAPNGAVAWIKDRVKPAAAVGRKRIEELVRQLDDSAFAVREQATKDLLEIGEQAVPALDRALAANPMLEMKRRLEVVRGKLADMILRGERLRAYRAVEILERLGTPEARRVLQALAEGAPEALLTASAREALRR